MTLVVLDHKLIGKDKFLGEGEVEVSLSIFSCFPGFLLIFFSQIWRHIQPAGAYPTTSADVSLELREGNGFVRIHLSYRT